MSGPDPMTAYPLPGQPRVCFLKAVVHSPNVEIGDYTYYDDPDQPERFAEKCVFYHYEFLGDRLIIGRFCAIATGARFIMNGANHSLAGISTYPFQIFGREWAEGFDIGSYLLETRGDTVIGNDVWIGAGATVLPGIKIGDGAVIGTGAMVAKDVPPYAIVAGNPARVVRRRFADDVVERLLALAWWNWDIDRITRNVDLLRNGDVAALEQAA